MFSRAEGPVRFSVAKWAMIRTRHMAVLGAGLAVLLQGWAAPMARVRADDQETIITGNPPPTEEQIRSLIARSVANQHRNDKALEEFERTEHVVTHKAGEHSETVSDRTDRLVPFGAGPIKLLTTENGSPVSRDLYRRELQFAVTALENAVHPNDRYRQDLVKFEKHQRDRAELVDDASRAFRMKWAGRETRSGRTLAKFLLEPDPNYKPTNRFGGAFEHAHAALWVDESEGQFARLEGDITSDITFVGGIAGKIYHGGHFVLEQSEVAPGVWLPTLYTYDVDGRKFVFGFGVHERTEVTRYRRVGPPTQAIELIRSELNNLSAETPIH
jgi:hypothetical protein